MRRRILAPLLLSVLLASCAGKVNQNPNQKADQSGGISGDNVLRAAKTFGRVLASALDEGINLEAQLAANGTIDKDVEPGLRAELLRGKGQVADFNARIAKYDHFDPASRADIAAFLDEAVAFISNANANGVLHIKNPNSQLIASGILLGARTAITVFRATFDNAQPAQTPPQ